MRGRAAGRLSAPPRTADGTRPASAEAAIPSQQARIRSCPSLDADRLPGEFVADRLGDLEPLIGRIALVDDLAYGLQHRHPRLPLENVPTHVPPRPTRLHSSTAHLQAPL